MTRIPQDAGSPSALVLLLVAGVVVLVRATDTINRTNVVAYFDNSNGIYVGDDVRILGVPVGRIATIEPQPERVKISFWYDSKYKVPADAKAAILSPTLVTSRAIQLTPAYTGGPVMDDDTVIPQDRTAVPVEWDQVRAAAGKAHRDAAADRTRRGQPAGSVINTTADNLRGQGANIRDTVIKLSQAFSALGDHSTDIFSTIKNLAILVSALQDSTDLMRQLNQNLASVTGLLADNPDEVGDAVRDLNAVVGDVQTFVAENREALGTTSDKLAGVTQALNDSLDDVKQFLHVAPNTLQNYVNIWQPAQGAVSSVPVINNFANPIPSFAAQFRRRHGWAPNSRRSCACSTSRRSSRTASTTSCPLGAEPRSSVPRRGRMRSPTARTGCGRLHSAAAAAAAPAAATGARRLPRRRRPRAAAGRRGADRDQPGRRAARA